MAAEGQDVTESQKVRALRAIAQGKSVAAAAKAGRMGRTTLWRLRTHDPDFARRYEEAFEAGTDLLEDSAAQQAKGGETRLMELLLKARRPHLYRPPVSDPRANHAAQEELIKKMALQEGLSEEDAEAAVREAQAIMEKSAG